MTTNDTQARIEAMAKALKEFADSHLLGSTWDALAAHLIQQHDAQVRALVEAAQFALDQIGRFNTFPTYGRDGFVFNTGVLKAALAPFEKEKP